jgi:hypothetical protein
MLIKPCKFFCFSSVKYFDNIVFSAPKSKNSLFLLLTNLFENCFPYLDNIASLRSDQDPIKMDQVRLHHRICQHKLLIFLAMEKEIFFMCSDEILAKIRYLDDIF